MLKKILILILFSGYMHAKDVIEKNEYCSINWSKGEITCEGESAPNQEKFGAKRAAVVIAQRNLLELIKSVRIDSETTIQNGMLKSDIIKSSVSGMIRGAQAVTNIYNETDQSAIATVKISMGKDLLKALLADEMQVSWNEKIEAFFSFFMTSNLYANEVYTPSDKATLEKLRKDFQSTDTTNGLKYIEGLLSTLDNNVATGLLIDAREIPDFEPALIVKLVNTKGEEIYPGNYIKSKQFIGKNGVSVGLDFDMQEAKINKRVFNTPLELKSSSVYKNKKSHIVLSDEDIKKLVIVANSLQEAKVIVVVSE
ncbi:hypothetical protein [Sulfurimonas sp.]|uniref:hypothetical protein n=1 Tax=Sulfurimonas sp. TaxID=2022749 RepID=UPI003D0D78EC